MAIWSLYIPVKSFCIFVVISIAVNYFLIVVIVPAIIIWVVNNEDDN